jgi:ER membrane protein complex subunit 6
MMGAGMQQPGAPAGGAEKTVSEQLEAQKLVPDALRKNIRQMDLARIVLYIAVGVICGVCGFTGLQGFLFYVLSSAVITLALTAAMGFSPRTYVNETVPQLFVSNMSGQVMSFIMFWTLAYSLVYVY